MANREMSINVASDFVKKWEKLASKVATKLIYFPFPESLTISGESLCYAYKDAGGKWTIGWGTVKYKDGNAVRQGDVISKTQADEEFNYEIRRKEDYLSTIVNYENLTNEQYATCISIAYNAGEYSLKWNGLLDAINAGQHERVVQLIKKHAITVNNGSRVVQGLINRRLDEVQLYEGDYNELYSYYLRNQKPVLIIVGISLVVVSVSVFLYFKFRSKS